MLPYGEDTFAEAEDMFSKAFIVEYGEFRTFVLKNAYWMPEHLITPSDSDLLLKNGQMYRLSDSIVEIIDIITSTESILCYQWRPLQGSADLIVRSLLYETSTTILEHSAFNQLSQGERIITVSARGTFRTSGLELRRIVLYTLCCTQSRKRSKLCPSFVSLLFAEQVAHLSPLHRYIGVHMPSSRMALTLLIKYSLFLYSRLHFAQFTAAAIALADCPNWSDFPCVVLPL